MKALDYNGLDHLIDKIYDTVNSGGSADYIVEEDYDGAWYRRLWASGISECWCINYSLGSCAMTNKYGNGYYISKSGYSFPIDSNGNRIFISAPHVSVNTYSDSGLINVSLYYISKDTYSFYLYDMQSETKTVYINVYARGLWKEFTQSVMKSATLDTYYPVGSIYISVSSTFNPNTSFGGTWVKLTNRFLVGAGGTYSLGATGGEATHTLTANEMPKHSHTNIYATDSGGNASWGYNYQNGSGKGSVSSATPDSGGIGYAGGSAAHNNLPPYQAVNMWQRTA